MGELSRNSASSPWPHTSLNAGLIQRHGEKIGAQHFLGHLRWVPAYDPFSQKKISENGLEKPK